jgi:membrane protein implicated in regulation of membrane protease activity
MGASTVDEVTVEEPTAAALEEVRRRRRTRRNRIAGWLAPTSPALVYAGVTLIVAALAVLAYTWSRVAGTAIVALQLPYIASGAFAGIGLIVVGVLLIYLGVRRREAWERERRLESLATALGSRAQRNEQD